MFFALVVMPVICAGIRASAPAIKQWRAGARLKGQDTFVLHPRMVTAAEREELATTTNIERVRFINDEAELRMKLICQLVPAVGEPWRNLNQALTDVVQAP